MCFNSDGSAETANQITAMLLGLGESQLLHMLEARDVLHAKVEEAHQALLRNSLQVASSALPPVSRGAGAAAVAGPVGAAGAKQIATQPTTPAADTGASAPSNA